MVGYHGSETMLWEAREAGSIACRAVRDGSPKRRTGQPIVGRYDPVEWLILYMHQPPVPTPNRARTPPLAPRGAIRGTVYLEKETVE